METRRLLRDLSDHDRGIFTGIGRSDDSGSRGRCRDLLMASRPGKQRDNRRGSSDHTGHGADHSPDEL
jgi:hypothetical protein